MRYLPWVGAAILEGLGQQDRRRSRPFTEGILLHTVTRRYPLAVVTRDAADLLLLENAPVPDPGRQRILAARAGGVADEGLLDEAGHTGQAVHGLQVVNSGGFEISCGLLLSRVEM